MKILTMETGVEDFLSRVERTRRRALLLDYDGTIAPFCERRDEARPHPAVLSALNKNLRGGHTRVVLVSGRGVDDLLPLISGLCKRPEVWGSHGWERFMEDGAREVVPVPQSAMDALGVARDRARAAGFLGRCELKPVSLAVHWRGMTSVEQRALLASVKDAWGELSRAPASGAWSHDTDAGAVLEWHDFDGGAELRVPGRNKGDAVRTIVDELGAGGVIAYAGDDKTDEDAFAAVGDDGISLLVRHDLRETCAVVWLKSHEELAEFLTRWQIACTRGS